MTTFLSAYKALPAVAGRALLPVGFLARLPQPMLQLGMVLLVTTRTGSLGYAGLAAGVLSLGAAVGGPFVGRLADRHGQRPVIVAASLLNAAFAVVFVAEIALDVPRWLALATAALTGAATPQIGPLMRSRWVRLLRDRGQLSTAMSWEGAADEIVYILGPVVVSLFTLISPSLAMVAGAAMVAVFGVWAGVHPSAAAAGPAESHTVHAPVWRDPAIGSLLLVSLAIGAFFGGSQTAVTAVATLSGAAASAGLLYASMGVGSALTGLATSALPVSFRLGDRLAVFSGWLVLAVIPLLFVTSVPVVAALLFIVGCGVGPALITVYALAERQVSPERTGVTMTLISAGSVVGYSIGSSVGGQLAQDGGPGAAFTVSLAAVGLAAVVAVVRSTARPVGSPSDCGPRSIARSGPSRNPPPHDRDSPPYRPPMGPRRPRHPARRRVWIVVGLPGIEQHHPDGVVVGTVVVGTRRRRHLPRRHLPRRHPPRTARRPPVTRLTWPPCDRRSPRSSPSWVPSVPWCWCVHRRWGTGRPPSGPVPTGATIR